MNNSDKRKGINEIRRNIKSKILNVHKNFILTEVANNELVTLFSDKFNTYIKKNYSDELDSIELPGILELMYDYYLEEYKDDMYANFSEEIINNVAEYLKDTMFI